MSIASNSCLGIDYNSQSVTSFIFSSHHWICSYDAPHISPLKMTEQAAF